MALPLELLMLKTCKSMFDTASKDLFHKMQTSHLCLYDIIPAKIHRPQPYTA